MLVPSQPAAAVPDAHPKDWMPAMHQKQVSDLSAEHYVAAGLTKILLDNPGSDFLNVQDLLKFEGPIEEALQGYQTQAVATGQSFEHTVRLQAAVLGW